MLVSCLLPTYGRIPALSYLLEEAIECFLKQTYQEKELILCNDTPGQTLVFNHPQVRVINTNFRFPTLGDKLHWMLEQAQGQYICRWDDDDISLPWRLSASVAHLYDHVTSHREYTPPNCQPSKAEWRPENHWYDQRGEQLKETKHPGNTHIMSIWHRCLIEGVDVQYPGRACPSGEEDQTFNQHIWALGYPQRGTLLPLEDMFYLYRWGTGSKHLSGAGGGNTMQETYNSLSLVPPQEGTFRITPRWYQDHTARVTEATRRYRIARGIVAIAATRNP